MRWPLLVMFICNIAAAAFNLSIAVVNQNWLSSISITCGLFMAFMAHDNLVSWRRLRKCDQQLLKLNRLRNDLKQAAHRNQVARAQSLFEQIEAQYALTKKTLDKLED